jgi:multidrug efflux system outer membrane protein
MKKTDSRRSRWLAAGPLFGTCALLLGGCASDNPHTPPTASIPAQWQTPLPGTGTTAALPHGGSLTGLSQWWQQQNDPLLVELIMAAESVSPTVSTARSNIEQARASRVASGAAMMPTLDGTASASRGRSAPVNRTAPPISTTAQGGLQTSWEIDLFGQYAATRDADQQRLEGSQALWHSARVSVAAEVATQYYSLRGCEKLLEVARSDAASRAETARLAELSTKAGFQAPATAALARASAAEGNSNAIQQRALCDLDVKALVSLTAIDEPALRQKLASTPADLTQESSAPVISVPAQVLAQRPDVFNAAREVDAAHLEVGSARAQRFPRLSLSGSIAASKSYTASTTQRFDTWTVGPLQLTVPLFDGGASAANVEAAKARYEDAAAQYRGTGQPAEHGRAQPGCIGRHARLPRLIRRHRGPLQERTGEPGRTGRRPPHPAGRTKRPGHAATRPAQRLGCAVPGARRRLDRRRTARTAAGLRSAGPFHPCCPYRALKRDLPAPPHLDKSH